MDVDTERGVVDEAVMMRVDEMEQELGRNAVTIETLKKRENAMRRRMERERAWRRKRAEALEETVRSLQSEVAAQREKVAMEQRERMEEEGILRHYNVYNTRTLFSTFSF